ncbi:MAG: hypothetical protein ACREBC_10890 [Pyrinomonadaceae bacterium]
MKRPEPARQLSVHDFAAKFLEALAILLNCNEGIGARLPDGCCPDVLRVNTRNNVLFIGDAKVTESPGCRQTQARLLRYLSWVSAHVRRPRALGLFAICFPNRSDGEGWISMVELLGDEVGLTRGKRGVVEFDSQLFVAWFLYDRDCCMSRGRS